MRRHPIEARVCSAVGIVLAAIGCHATPSIPAPTELPSRPIEPEDKPEYLPRVETLGAAGGGAPDAGAPTAEGETTAFCAAYKLRTAVPSTPGIRETQLDYAPPPAESADWVPATRTVLCTLVREHTRVPMKRIYAPTCCPQPRGGQRPCPPAETVTIRGDRFLVEQAELREDGTLVRSTLVAATRDPHPPERHNCGRRPEGLRSATKTGIASVGVELAAMAELEAASVHAFERLARELTHLGAPPELVRRARAAMVDEVHHARVIGRLARAFGGSPTFGSVERLPCRDALEVAMENVAEGCVREAFGALVATFQANRGSPAVTRAFARIARDECRHAALAEDVHAWIVSRLTSEERAAVSRHRERALAELRGGLSGSPQCEVLGLPSPSEAHALYNAYFVNAA